MNFESMARNKKQLGMFDKVLLGAIGEKLMKKNETIAVAESVTSGLLQFALGSIPDAASFYQGGITTYNIGQKFKHLGVEPIHAKSVDCVSTKVATEMALNVCKLYGSDWGIAITGYATAVPESGNRIFCYYSIVYKNRIKGKEVVKLYGGQPYAIQLHYVETVLKKFRNFL